MHLRPNPTTANSSTAIPVATACGNCGVDERRLLHHVRHRGVFRRLCTTCVLRLHPQSFCPTCFQVYPPPPSNDAVLNCFKCYSSSHSRCVEAGPTSPPTPYICPLCLNPSTPIFKLNSAKDVNVKTTESMKVKFEDCRVMDRDSAKKLLAAAKIASASMNKAAVAAKAEAERRAKEAAFTRKRAKEALEHVAHLVMKEKLRRKEGPADVTGPGFGGIASNGAHTTLAVRENNVNVSNSNRNGSTASGSSRLTVVEEKLNSASDVDRDNSSQVLAALNAVELRENEKTGGETTAHGERSIVSRDDDHAPMDVDEKEGMKLIAGEDVARLVGERKNDSSSYPVNCSDMENGAETVNTQGEKEKEKGEGVNSDVVLVQPVEHQTQQKDSSNGGEQHSNGGSL